MKANKILMMLALSCLMLTIAGCDAPPGIMPQIGINGVDENGDSVDNNKVQEKVIVKLYRADKNLEWLVPEECTIENVKGEDKLKATLQALVSDKPKNNDTQNIFPEKTKVIDVKVQDGIAKADFSKELLEKNIGGSSYELMLVGSIVDTLTEFSEVKEVQILVEGETIETINGHMDLVDPLKRNESLIKAVEQK